MAEGNSETSAEILDYLAGSMVNSQNIPYEDPLLTTERAQMDSVGDALRMGASTERKNRFGMTPLVIASGANLDEIVAELLRFGALPDAQDNLGNTAYEYAKMGGNKEVCGVFAEYFRQVDQLRFGVPEDQQALLRALAEETLLLPLAMVLANKTMRAAVYKKAQDVLSGQDADTRFMVGLKGRLQDAWLCTRPIASVQGLVKRSVTLKKLLEDKRFTKKGCHELENEFIASFSQRWLFGQLGAKQDAKVSMLGAGIFSPGSPWKIAYPGKPEASDGSWKIKP